MRFFALRFLTRQGCHLCDVARPLVWSEAARLDIPITEVDINEEEDLLVKYEFRIPVLLAPDGQVLAEGVIDGRRALRRVLRRARKGKLKG